MMKLILGAFLLSASVPVLAEDAPNPVYDFLMAADEGNVEAMSATMDPKRGISSKKLLKKIQNCYLRAIYGNPENEIIAAWMCDEGDNKSRVLLANLYRSDDGAVVVIAREDRNNRPAPKRTGSAFAKEDDNG